ADERGGHGHRAGGALRDGDRAAPCRALRRLRSRGRSWERPCLSPGCGLPAAAPGAGRRLRGGARRHRVGDDEEGDGMIDPALQEILPKVPQGGETVFAKEEYDQRQAAFRRAMDQRGFDLVLISGAENIFYLTGQQTPGYYTFQSLAVPAKGEPFLVIRALEAMNARLNTFIADITGYPDDANPAAAVASVLKSRGWQGKRVAIDQNGWFLTVNLYQRLVAEF